MTLTPEQEALIAEAIRRRKPHLLEIEKEVERLGHGEVTLKIFIRSGVVDKVAFIDATRTWVKTKDIDSG